MDLQRLSGLIISTGFVLYVLAMLVAPRLYQTENIATRLEIVVSKQVRWHASQLLFASGIGVPATGFLLLTLSQLSAPASWLYYVGMVVFAAGAAIGIWLIYRQTLDPVAFWEGTQTSVMISYSLLLMLAGLLSFGIAMLQGDLPNLLAYLLAGSAGFLLVATLASRGDGGFFISVLVSLISSVAGIVIWLL